MPDLDKNNIQNPTNKTSAIKQSGFNRFLSTLFGWRKTSSNKSRSSVEFAQVDVGAKDQRVGQALINSAPNLKGPMSQKLEELFNLWLNDNTDKFNELQQRASRINQLEFMYLNDPYVNRTVELYADEATQLDQQDTLIDIETPDLHMTRDMYKLINQWGLTQSRIRETIRQMALFGDAFWANTVTEKGVERVVPLQQYQVTDRVEFNPIKALEMKKRREGFFGSFASNNYLIDQMLQAMEDCNSFSDLFDTKLFGFNIDDDLTVPAWSVTHFRVGADGSQFYPFGTSPILGALAPYKQTQSAVALQSLLRQTSFPITLFKVKTDENMDEAKQFALVNRVREEYDNIGVSQKVGNSEVYTVNTKIWIPDGLLDVEVKKAESSAESADVDDIKLYQDREAVALGIPKSFFGEDGWKSLNRSGKSLTQQYKPFARKCFSIQSAFLEGLADLFRLHFAITGIYDFRIPFTISMKYPVVEEDDDYTSSQKGSLEVAGSVIEFIKGAIGAAEDEPLPADIIRDIIGKYTFLDPADVIKWTRDAKYYVNVGEEGGGASGGFGGGENEGDNNIDIDIGGGEGSGDIGDIDLGGPGEEVDLSPDTGAEAPEETETTNESTSKKWRIENRLREYENRPMTEAQKLREKQLVESYNSIKRNLYFDSLKECAVNNFVRRGNHIEVFNTINNHTDSMLNVLNSQHAKTRLTESSVYKKSRKRKKQVSEEAINDK